jgi:hypothetical protein
MGRNPRKLQGPPGALRAAHLIKALVISLAAENEFFNGIG